MLKNIRTLALCKELTPFFRKPELQFEYFSALTAQWANKCLLSRLLATFCVPLAHLVSQILNSFTITADIYSLPRLPNYFTYKKTIHVRRGRIPTTKDSIAH